MSLLSLIRRRAGAAAAIALGMGLSLHIGVLIGLRMHIEREGAQTQGAKANPPNPPSPPSPPGQTAQAAPARDGGLGPGSGKDGGTALAAQPLPAPVRLEAVGELGVTRGPLPYPTDVLAGLARPAESAPGQALPPAGEAPALPDGGAGPQEGLGADGVSGAGAVSGQVVDERGLPVPGARIEAQVGRARRLVLSDSSGRFTLRGLPPGAISVAVQHRSYAPLRSRIDEGGELRLQLQPGGGIEGRVRDRRLGGVPERLQLTITTAAGQRAVPVGRDGGFRLTGLPPGEATLRAQAPGYEPLSQEVQIPAGDRPESVTLRDLLLELAPSDQ
jgi:hypothetical protein